MEVTAAGGLFQGYPTAGIGGSKTETSSPLAGRAKSDQVTLSKQVLAVIQMQNRIRAIEQARENAQNSSEVQALESMQKAMDVLKVCNKIAARIRAGDHVPLKDLRYLIKNDPMAYQMAMASRKPKEDPKQWESAVPKEKPEAGQPAHAAGCESGLMQAASGSECSSEAEA